MKADNQLCDKSLRDAFRLLCVAFRSAPDNEVCLDIESARVSIVNAIAKVIANDIYLEVEKEWRNDAQ